MGKVVVTEFITLDGVIEAPGGGDGFEYAGWSFRFDRGKDGDAFKYAELMSADVQLLGRVTYDGFAQAWPTMAGTNEFADKMNAMPKCVVSNTLPDTAATWTNSTVIRGDVAAQIEKLRREVVGDILVAGSATLVRSLAEHDLVDEYRLMTYPVILGAGRRLFTEGTRHTTLRLVSSQPIGPDGVVILTYVPARLA